MSLRNDPALLSVAGMMVGTVALRTRINSTDRFAAVLDEVRRVDLEAMANADVSFDDVVAKVDPPRRMNEHPLFTVMLAYRRALELPQIDGITVFDIDNSGASTGYDLTWDLVDTGDSLTIRLLYATDKFRESTAELFMQRVRRIAESVTAEPEIVIGEIELLSGLERSALTAANPRHVEPLTIADIFERALRQAPDGVALEENGRRWTYRDLHEESSHWTRELVVRGIGPDDVVAVALGRGHLWDRCVVGSSACRRSMAVARSGAADSAPADDGRGMRFGCRFDSGRCIREFARVRRVGGDGRIPHCWWRCRGIGNTGSPRQPRLRHLHVGFHGKTQGRGGFTPRNHERLHRTRRDRRARSWPPSPAIGVVDLRRVGDRDPSRGCRVWNADSDSRLRLRGRRTHESADSRRRNTSDRDADGPCDSRSGCSATVDRRIDGGAALCAPCVGVVTPTSHRQRIRTDRINDRGIDFRTDHWTRTSLSALQSLVRRHLFSIRGSDRFRMALRENCSSPVRMWHGGTSPPRL